MFWERKDSSQCWQMAIIVKKRCWKLHGRHSCCLQQVTNMRHLHLSVYLKKLWLPLWHPCGRGEQHGLTTPKRMANSPAAAVPGSELNEMQASWKSEGVGFLSFTKMLLLQPFSLTQLHIQVYDITGVHSINMFATKRSLYADSYEESIFWQNSRVKTKLEFISGCWCICPTGRKCPHWSPGQASQNTASGKLTVPFPALAPMHAHTSCNLDSISDFTCWILRFYLAQFPLGSHLQWPTGHHRGCSPDGTLLDGHELERILGIQEGRKTSLEDL